MDGTKFVLIGLPIYLFCSDILSIFTLPLPLLPPPPPPPTYVRHDHPLPRPLYQPVTQLVQDQPLRFPSQAFYLIIS
ncbi:hypothetical protein EZV62_016644 [Acer yangbiense]|uniref:Uncharacterized protein n=1 Tax=Acer yangbiense TaxID=1000413 RepID=A0A5C7HPX9_9ROSI|nr:hypothetical protein EZV62_016644 [Acer yangbiense]